MQSDLQKNYPHNKTLHALFEAQVKKTPNNIALVYEDVRVTYTELNERANQIAHYLIKTHSLQPDSPITLCLERNENVIIAIMAVLKAGAAYVPIDPKYPSERIRFIMEDTQAKVMIDNEWLKKSQSSFLSEPKTNLVTPTTKNNLSYIIYTSGTTGKPKGVMLEHEGVINNAVVAIESVYDFTKGNKVTAFASYAFDSSIPEIFFTLLRGGELHFLSEDVRMDAFKISHYIENQNINFIYLPPVLLAILPRKTYPSLKGIIYAGEPCDANTVSYWSERVALYNFYGPTEGSVSATYKKIENGCANVIGKPLKNVQCHVLNTKLQPVPITDIGELYIGGIGVARGYLNRPELTAERFIHNPFQTEHEKMVGINSKLYKTGDLVRALQNGDLEYIGRTDFQVKIRGFRIELGEIENVLNSYSFNGTPVTQSVVIATKYLIAYYVSPVKFNDDDIFEYFRNKLPEHMIPSFFVHLEKMPFTLNGKIDRKALPEPEWTQKDNSASLQNEDEKNIGALFAEVLDIPKNQVGLRDNFFRIGGNSILATKLVAKINNHFNSQLSVSDIFLAKTIEVLGKIVSQKKSWENVVCFSHSSQAKTLFMIHPGMGGCEVYAPLVHKLSAKFNCYGIDAYNFYHDDKIEDLKILSQYYLTSIHKIMEQTNQNEYHLLGWSLGGKIALEMAALLEQKGVTKINLYILDTILFGDVREDPEEVKNLLTSKGVDPSYIEKSLALVDIAQKLHECKLSSKLKHTQILLFKALIPTRQKSGNYGEFKRKIALKYNHIDKCLKSKKQIKVVRVNEKHGELLNQADILISEILNFDTNHVSYSDPKGSSYIPTFEMSQN